MEGPSDQNGVRFHSPDNTTKLRIEEVGTENNTTSVLKINMRKQMQSF